MNKTSTIQKQVIAFLLVGVFLFIHVGKVLHTHETVITAEKTFGTSQVSKTADCSICDFDFSKNAGQQTFFVEPAYPVFSPTKHAPLQSRTTSSTGLSYADRGPPALL